MFKGKKIVYIFDLKEMNKHIEFCLKYRVEAPSEMWAKQQNNPQLYYTLEVKYTRVILRYTYVTFTEYIFQLDGSEHSQAISGMRAFNILQRMSHKGVPDLTKNELLFDLKYNEWKVGNIGGLIYFNPEHIGERLDDCYEYDMNNAYSWAMEQPIPNTKIMPRMFDKTKKGEIGFRVEQRGLSNDMCLYAVFEPGVYGEYIYQAIDSPFVKFAQHFYKLRKTAVGREKEKMKQTQNYAIGYIRRKNPFIHSCILSRCRYYIESLVDENTLYCNTDSIISHGRRPDIDSLIKDEIGGFKIKHTGTFAYNGSGYQWNKEQPSVRGKSKQWFKNAYPNGFDILKDSLPFIEANMYIYNKEKGRIEKNGSTETESEEEQIIL